tara:strand:- start:844 stop:1167 length:324 start_codon:yes stop_codon:yes gene_type:complete
MSNNPSAKTKRIPREDKTYEVNEIDNITEEIELTLHALRMQMANSDYRDPAAVSDVRGKLDNLVEKVAIATGTDDDRGKKGIMAQLGRRLFSAPSTLSALSAKSDDK